MARFNSRLDRVSIAAPCKADWDQMMGTARALFCGQCNLNVYNLSDMTKEEAESLIARSEGRLCIRFYRRADGSILTSNCPIGLRAMRRKVSYFARATSSAVLSFLAGIGLYQGLSSYATPKQHYRMGVMVQHMGQQAIAPEPGQTEGVTEMDKPESLGRTELIPYQGISRRKKGHASYR